MKKKVKKYNPLYDWINMNSNYSNEFPNLIDRSNLNNEEDYSYLIHEATKQLFMA